ncbi:MAG: FHA domain-containing protein, partial [Myxococcota bacterium]
MGRLIYKDNKGLEHIVPIGPTTPVVSIGRATDCTIRSDRRLVSKRHAEFRYTLSGQVEIVDLHSSNGTYLVTQDKRQVVSPRATVSDRDEVWCGDFIVLFEEASEDSSSLGAPIPPSPFGAQPLDPSRDEQRMSFDIEPVSSELTPSEGHERLTSSSYNRVSPLEHGFPEPILEPSDGWEDNAHYIGDEEHTREHVAPEISESSLYTTLEARLVSESMQVHSELEQARSEQLRLEERLQAALEDVARASEARVDAERQLALARQAHERELDEARTELDRLRRAHDQTQGDALELDSMQRELERVQLLLSEFERRHRELDDELEDTKRREADVRQDFERQLASATKLGSLASEQEEKLRVFERENASWADRVQQLESALKDSRSNLGAQLAEVERELAELHRAHIARTAQRDEALNLIAELEVQLAAQAPSLRDRELEAEGLRQRLKLDKDRWREQEQLLNSELEDMAATLEAMRVERDKSVSGHGPFELCDRALKQGDVL